MSEFTAEIEEAERLLENATYPRLKSVLTQHINNLRKTEKDQAQRLIDQQAATQVKPSSVPVAPVQGAFIPIESYAWDQGEYNSPTLSIFVDLDGVGAVKDNVVANFTKMSFDVQVTGLNGKNYRLLKDNLEKDIVPDKSKCIVKKDKIVLKLQKVKGEYSFEHWNSLTAKKKRGEDSAAKKDPMGGMFAALFSVL